MKLKDFFRKPSTIAFLAFTALYAACMAFIFWGTWALDKAPVGPDNAIAYAVNDGAKWFADLCAGARFVPSDLMHVLGGMYFWQELQYALAAYLAALGVAFYLRGRRVPLVGAYGGGADFYDLKGVVEALLRAARTKDVRFTADMKMGTCEATAWGCDLTYDYVKINGDYRS